MTLSNLLGVDDGTPPTPLRTDGDVGIGVGDAAPVASLDVVSSHAFDHPQVRIVQTTPNEWARLRFVSTVLSSGDPDKPHLPVPTLEAFWDIAVGGGYGDVLNIFHEGTRNVVTLTPNGNVGVGIEYPAVRLDVAGTARVAVLEITGGGDLAEPFELVDGSAEPGTVLVIDPDRAGRLRESCRAYDHRVAGVVSGARGLEPSIVLGATPGRSGSALVALSGRAWCRAVADPAPISPGDLLTTADVPGCAMRAGDVNAARGAILGKAMTTLDRGRGLVLALIALH
jgi:hypothetical protein